MAYVLEFLKALAFTLIMEIPVLFVGARYVLKIPNNKVANSTLIFTGILASLCTLPYLWFVLPEFIPNYTHFLLVGESSIALLESFIYCLVLRISFKRALILSLFCNVFSFGLGKILLH